MEYVSLILKDPSMWGAVIGSLVAVLGAWGLLRYQLKRQFDYLRRQLVRDKLEHSAELITEFRGRLDAVTTAVLFTGKSDGIPPSPIYALRLRLEAYAPHLVELAERIDSEVNSLYQAIGSYSATNPQPGGITATQVNKTKSRAVSECNELGRRLAEEQRKYVD